MLLCLVQVIRHLDGQLRSRCLRYFPAAMLVYHIGICNMADLVQWHSRMKVEKKKNTERRNRKRWRNRQAAVNETQFVPYCSILFVCLLVLSIFVDYRWNVPRSRTVVNLFDKLKSGLMFILACVRHFVKCHSNYVNRARVLIGRQLTTHVCQSFTSQTCQIRVWKSWRE